MRRYMMNIVLTNKAKHRIQQTMGKDALLWCHTLVQYVLDNGTVLDNTPKYRLKHAREKNIIFKAFKYEMKGICEEWRGRFIKENNIWIVVDFYKVKHRTIRTRKRTRLDDAHKGLYLVYTNNHS